MDMYIEGINFFEKRRFKKFINALKKTKLMDNSIVVVVGDHGEDWNENNQGHNRGNLADGLTEGNIKVPLIFYGTNLPRKINLNRVRTIDIVPTTLSLLGIHCDVKFDGLDLFDHKNTGKDLDAYSQIWETNSANVTILMNKVKKTGTMETPNFSSKLASSVLFKNDVKIEKNYKKEKIYCKNKNFLINNKTKDEMRKSLNSYNNKTKDSLLKQEKIAKKVGKTELAEQLRCLGYNV
jgi:hypothetical protein